MASCASRGKGCQQRNKRKQLNHQCCHHHYCHYHQRCQCYLSLPLCRDGNALVKQCGFGARFGRTALATTAAVLLSATYRRGLRRSRRTCPVAGHKRATPTSFVGCDLHRGLPVRSSLVRATRWLHLQVCKCVVSMAPVVCAVLAELEVLVTHGRCDVG